MHRRFVFLFHLIVSNSRVRSGQNKSTLSDVFKVNTVQELNQERHFLSQWPL